MFLNGCPLLTASLRFLVRLFIKRLPLFLIRLQDKHNSWCWFWSLVKEDYSFALTQIDTVYNLPLIQMLTVETPPIPGAAVGKGAHTLCGRGKHWVWGLEKALNKAIVSWEKKMVILFGSIEDDSQGKVSGRTCSMAMLKAPVQSMSRLSWEPETLDSHWPTVITKDW